MSEASVLTRVICIEKGLLFVGLVPVLASTDSRLEWSHAASTGANVTT